MTTTKIPPQLTTVVNYWPEQPTVAPVTDAQRALGHTPIYKLAALQESIKSPRDLVLATRKCREDVAAELLWTVTDVHRELLGLVSGEYVNSAWCQTGSKWWCPCDAYVVKQCETGNEGQYKDVYLKFGLGPTGKLLLVVSCHPAIY